MDTVTQIRVNATALIKVIPYSLHFVLDYRTYLKVLVDHLVDLEDQKERVYRELDEAPVDGGMCSDVSLWLDKANDITKQARGVLADGVKNVSLNPFTRSRIARKARRTTREIEECRQQGHHCMLKLSLRVREGAAKSSYKDPYPIAKSRASIFVDISKALLDAKVRIVGIWGTSGVGKSIFLKQLEKQVQEKELDYDFDGVTMATVSRSPDWEKIQDDLGYRLGLKMEGDNNMDRKAVRLRDRLSQEGKVLVILDDIWEKIDLEKLGIPLDDNHPKVKLLMSSRSEQVLRSKMDSEHNFHLEPLQPSEATDLFMHILGDRAQENATLIYQLANECAGLPVRISLLATYLKSLPSILFQKVASEAEQKFRITSLDDTINQMATMNFLPHATPQIAIHVDSSEKSGEQKIQSTEEAEAIVNEWAVTMKRSLSKLN